MYIYYDSKGVLKEIVNDDAIRQGNSNFNKIYFFIEGADPQIVDNVYQALLFNNGLRTFIDVEGNNLTTEQFSLITVNKQIPFDKKRELKFFKYFTDYQMFEITVPDEILNESGTVGCRIQMTLPESTIMTLGLLVFNVEFTSIGQAIIQPDTAINIAQWNYLVANMVSKEAFNIENGDGDKALQQKQDGTGGVFDFTNKNPNATALDPTLTGEIAYGGVGNFATSFGGKSQASGKRSLAEGTTTVAKGNYSHAEGDNSVSLGSDSHAEGYTTTAYGMGSHSEGHSTITKGVYSHAEGNETKTGVYTEIDVAEKYDEWNQGGGEVVPPTPSNYESVGSHSEGDNSIASGHASHSEGSYTQALGNASHSEGTLTIARANNSHTTGTGTEAINDSQTVIGRWNSPKSDTLFEVGNGVSPEDRSNALEVYEDGRVAVGANPINNMDLVPKKYLEDVISAIQRRAFTKVDITLYPTLASFLLSTGEEGIIYLYPIDTSDLTKGFKQYIWEDNSWLFIGDTNLDLTNYVTTDTDQTITGVKTFSNGLKVGAKSELKEVGANFVVAYDGANAFYVGSTYIQSNKTFIPAADGAYDLGISSGGKWRNLYLNGNANFGTNNVGIKYDTNNYRLIIKTNGGYEKYIFGDTFYVQVNMQPIGSNTYNLGGSGAKWNNVWANTLKGLTTLTQAQYDALVSGGTVDADTLYLIEEE